MTIVMYMLVCAIVNLISNVQRFVTVGAFMEAAPILTVAHVIFVGQETHVTQVKSVQACEHTHDVQHWVS